MKGLEDILHQELKGFFAKPGKIALHFKEAIQNLAERPALLLAHQKEIQKVRDEMARTHRLYKTCETWIDCPRTQTMD